MLLLLGAVEPTLAQGLKLEGQLSSWFIINNQEPSTPGVGVRYLPTFSLSRPLEHDRLIDGEIALNAYGFGQAPSWTCCETTGQLGAYRAWGRLKLANFEARAGLQKINFGSATLLRPLRWFDSVDPRDPLQITDGVYALLVRGYLRQNVSVWGWGLYGNDRLKGFETTPTARHSPELGGRLQVPLFKGEAAFSTHHRRADLSRAPPGSLGALGEATLEDPLAREQRYAADGKWDVGIGLWVEGTWVRRTHPRLPVATERAATVGADYTFGVGNGLNVLGEFFTLNQAGGNEAPSGRPGTVHVQAATLSYPVSWLDVVSAIAYFDGTTKEAYRFVSWQRTYDRWRFYVMGFWNPVLPIPVVSAGASSGTSPPLMSGKGLQLMAVFNHAWEKPLRAADRSGRP